MAGKIVVSTLQSDTDNSISFVANTGATIFSANLSNGIAGSFIGAGSITGDKIGATAINANNIVSGTITGDKIGVGQITGNLLTANCVSGNNIVANTITANLFSTTIYASNNDIMGISANANTFGNTIIIVAGNTSSISVGDIVSGANVFPGTTVLSFNSPPSNRSNITVSKALAGSNTNTAVQFYSSTKVISPGIAGPGLCKAWVNFDGTGSVYIRAAFNVSSIGDLGTGQYQVNFINAMPDANYSISGSDVGSNASLFYSFITSSGDASTTTYFRFVNLHQSATASDQNYLMLQVFR